MRIVLVSDCYPPRVGGIESQVAALRSALLARGHDVRVVTATAGPAGDGVVRLAGHAIGSLPVDLWGAIELPPVVRDADVVHVHAGQVSPFAAQAVRICLDECIPLLVTWHSAQAGLLSHLPAALSRVRAMPLAWPDDLFRPRARVLLSAVSDAAAAPLRRRSGGRVEVAVLPNLVELGPWRDAGAGAEHERRAAGQEPGVADSAVGVPRPLRLAATMRLAPRKHAGLLVRVARAVPQARIDVYGDGPFLAPLRALSGRSRLPEPSAAPSDSGRSAEFQASVRSAVPPTSRNETPGVGLILHGRKSTDELCAAYRDADAFLAPAPLETFGIAALEARAAGLPVVAFERSGVASFIESGRDGLLVDCDAGFVDAVHRLATDRDLLATVRRGADTPPPIRPDVVLDQLDRLYARLARGAGSSGP